MLDNRSHISHWPLPRAISHFLLARTPATDVKHVENLFYCHFSLPLLQQFPLNQSMEISNSYHRKWDILMSRTIYCNFSTVLCLAFRTEIKFSSTRFRQYIHVLLKLLLKYVCISLTTKDRKKLWLKIQKATGLKFMRDSFSLQCQK